MPQETDAELASKVIAVIAKAQRIPVESITLDSTFDELKIDSLDGINIIFALESEFNINIPDEGVHNLKAVRETVDGVAKLLAEKEAPAPAATTEREPSA